MKRSLFGLTLVALVALTPQNAAALDIPRLDLKLGLRGGPSVPFMQEPSGMGDFATTPYTNYYGLGYNVGLALHFRMLNVISVELGWMRSWDTMRGRYELDDVLDRSATPAQKQELGQVFEAQRDHIPIVAQLALPIGVARPFLSFGVDVVTNTTNRSYRVEELNDTVPIGDDYSGLSSQLTEDWRRSTPAQNALNAGLDEAPGTHLGIIAGLGVDIALDKFEIPVEFRMHFYPEAGGAMSDRGTFPSGTQQAFEAANAPRYNDTPTMQLFILFGFDYVIF